MTLNKTIFHCVFWPLLLLALWRIPATVDMIVLGKDRDARVLMEWGSVTYDHPHYAPEMRGIYGQYSIVPCYDVWDMNQRTNCRVREWSVWIDGWKPHYSWRVTSIDVNGNWYDVVDKK